MIIKGLNRWILPAYHNLMFDYQTRITVLYGGAGSGKSYFGVQKYIIKALQHKRKILVIRKVSATLKSSIWDLFLEELSFMPQVVKSVNKSEMAIEFINGSMFLFKGLDDPEKIKSIQGITDILIEEATELSVDDFTQLNLRLRAKKGMLQITLMFNPVSKANWVYKYFFADGAPENCIILQTTYKDNPHLPDEYVRSLRELESKNPAYYKIYVKGEFATLDKLVFPTWTKELINVEDLHDAWFWCGLDFGYTNDPTALTWGYYEPDGKKLYITGEYTKRGLTNDKIAEVIKSLGLAKEKIVADSAEQKSITEIRQFGIPRIMSAVKGPDSIKNGIDRLQRCEIHIDERCRDTIEEFENYTWQKDRQSGEYINKPVDTFNHHIDSIRYGIQTVIKKKQQSELYKPIWN